MNRAVTPGALFDTGVGDALDDLALEAQEHGQQGQDSEDRGRHRFCVLNGRSSDESTEPDRNALYEPGVRVPSDVSVVGFDDVEESAFATPALTSIRPDKNAMAALGPDTRPRSVVKTIRSGIICADESIRYDYLLSYKRSLGDTLRGSEKPKYLVQNGVTLKLRVVLGSALLTAGLLAMPTTAGAASGQRTVPAPAHAGKASSAPVAPTYQNPLKLALPAGGVAASCADPFVLRGPAARTTTWYLYCTSDALSATELGPDGTPLIHNVPTYSSTDLTHWTYTGDAFPTKPAWISGGMWAPDVVRRGGQYLMYFTASDTTLPGGGSAIAVATSPTPTGPWHVSATPVVPPTDSPTGPGRRWEFDPEVITTGSTSYVYFGSYFGGIYARRLSADGLTSVASSETPIAIDNRYEGTYIVQRDGWYYFMGSATNCCNGTLTGYAVFVARSRSPLGPFLDRNGVSILAGRVGGTPMLTQNGNRWVGTGHNAVVTDFSGQQWIVYHAVDKNDPYYAGDVGYTKRPVLMDPLDWRGGWPVVRGGYGPSDSPQPGPAAQPGQRTAYHARFFQTPRPARLYPALSDSFTGSTLSPQWTWIRPPAPSQYSVSDGALAVQTQNADLHPPATPLASVLTEPAPPGDYVVEAKVSVSVPAEGCCQNYVQGGVVIYGDDGNYVKLASSSIFDTRQTEFGNNATPQPTGYPTYGNTVVGPVGAWTYLRIVHQRRHGVDTYTAYTSLDGQHWEHGGTWDHSLGAAPRIGLISMGGTGFTSRFAYVRVSALSHRSR